jgi:hypothetical protein
MVAKIISGKNMRGALNYNEQKVSQGKAECILASMFPKELARLTFKDKLERFNKLHERNRRTHTNTLHISLNFDKTDKLTVADLQALSTAYMDKIGFGDQPYLVYDHRDAAHPHVHILTTLIQPDGKRIPIHNLGKNQSEQARVAIEKEFGLVEATSRSKAAVDYIRPVELEKVVYGKSETRRGIVSVVRAVTTSYRYTSLAELNAVLSLYNVRAERGHESSQMYQRRGLLYSAIDAKGNSIGVPVKASAIYGKPTLDFLERQYKLNEILRKQHRDAIRESVDKTLAQKTGTKLAFTKALLQSGITPVFRENAEGKIYGLTFVDQHRQVVFKGSDLGKAYSAAAILSRLQANSNSVSEVKYTPDASKEKREESGPIAHAPNFLMDIVTPDTMGASSPDAALKLGRRRKRRKGNRL